VTVTVWVDDWQMQCCGDPFDVGSKVWWNVVEPDVEWLSAVLGPELASHVTYREEHHGRESRIATGLVRRIHAVHYRTAPLPDGPPNHHYPVSGSARLRVVAAADGWDEPFEGAAFGGYLVDLDVVEN
jgi:uncharacterized protein DUF6578